MRNQPKLQVHLRSCFQLLQISRRYHHCKWCKSYLPILNEVVTENDGKYFVTIENSTKVDEAKDFVEIKYKTLVEGDVRISFKDFTIDEAL